jgi:hypothetical protein
VPSIAIHTPHSAQSAIRNPEIRNGSAEA